MRSKRWTLTLALAACGLAALLAGLALAKPPKTPPPPPPPPIQYSVTWLGTLGGGGSFAYGINSQGDVVGAAAIVVGSPSHAFLYTASAGMVDLNSLIDPQSGWVLVGAKGINDAGQIVGGGYNPSGLRRAFRYTPQAGTWGKVDDLGVPSPEYLRSSAYEINNWGEVCGTYSANADGSGKSQAFYFSDATGMVSIFPDGRGSTAYAINDDAQVVGQLDLEDGTNSAAAFRYTPDGAGGGSVELFMPPRARKTGYTFARACDINNDGTFTGYWNTVGIFRYTDGSGVKGLGGEGTGYGINNNGDVTGWAFISGCSFFVYTDAWGLRSLDGFIPGGAAGDGKINDAGQICGRTLDNRAFLLTPIR